MVSKRRTLHGSQGAARCLGPVSGFLLKIVRESVGLTQVQLAEHLGVDVATVQGWESARRPLAALRVADLVWLRSRLVQCGAQPTALAILEDAIAADLIIAASVQAGGQPIDAEQHALGATVHQHTLTNLIMWPFTGVLPPPLRELPKQVRSRRGPVPDRPILTAEQRTRFFDHLLVTAQKNLHESAALLRRQAIYLLGFDARESTIEWLHSEQHRALRNATNTDHVPSWVAVRSSAVALASTGNRDPLQAFLQQTRTRKQLEQANLNYWAYWVGEIGTMQIDDGFMCRVDPRGWTGVRLLGHLLERLRPGAGQTELNLHTLWALLLTHPTLLTTQPTLCSTAATRIESLAEDRDLSAQAQRELSDVAYAIRLAQR